MPLVKFSFRFHGMLVLSGLALAHVPHDTVRAFVAPSDGSGAEPWFVLLDAQGVYLWARSDDAGDSWMMVGGPPMAEKPQGAARMDDGTVAILGSDHLWLSPDGGLSWVPELPPAEVDAIRGGPLLVLAGPGGLYVGEPGAWATVTTSPVSMLGPGAAWASDEGVWIESAGLWTLVDGPAVPPTALASNVESFVGTADGEVYRWDGADWTPCADLPSPADAAHDDVVQLLVADGSVYAATGGAAPYLAPAHCGAWASAALAPIRIDYGPDGGAESEAEAWTSISRLGTTLALAGWPGLALSVDEGATWDEPQLIPPDYTRGIAFEPGFPENPKIFVGAYASGVQVTADGGRTWTAPNHGIDPTNVQWVVPSPVEDDVVYAIVNHIGWVSRDGGSTWTEFTPGGSTVAIIWPLPQAGRAWLVASGLYETVDSGARWTERTDVTSAMNDRQPAGLVQDGLTLCATVPWPSTLYCSFDDGVSWSELQAGTSDGTVSPPRMWPPGAPERVVWGDGLGLHAVGIDGADPLDVALEPIVELTMAADGTLFAGATSGQLYRSDDGGDTWSTFGAHLPAYIHVLVPRPDWAEHPELFVGTHAGVFVVDASGTATRLAYQRVDDSSSYLACTGCSAQESGVEWSLDSIQPLDEGATMTATLRGNRLVINGRAEDGAAFGLRIDGLDSTVGPLPATEGVLLDMPLGADVVHDVMLAGLPGPTIAIDSLEMFGTGAVIDVSQPEPGPAASSVRVTDYLHVPEDSAPPADTGEPAPPTRNCACGSAKASPLLGVLALFELRRQTWKR